MVMRLITVAKRALWWLCLGGLGFVLTVSCKSGDPGQNRDPEEIVDPQAGKRPPAGEVRTPLGTNYRISCEATLTANQMAKAVAFCNEYCASEGNDPANCAVECEAPTREHCGGEPITQDPAPGVPTTPPPGDMNPEHPVPPVELLPPRELTPLEKFLATSNPCGVPDELCVVKSALIFKVSFPKRDQDRTVIFRRTLGTHLKFPIKQMRFMKQKFRVKLKGIASREAQSNGFDFYYTSAAGHQIQLLKVPNALYTVPVTINRQQYDVKFTILSWDENLRCRYKTILYSKLTGEPVGFMDGSASCR